MKRDGPFPLHWSTTKRRRRVAARIIANPFVGWLLWLGFAAVFFQSGASFTAWMLEPETFGGGLAWIWVGVFPLLLLSFFVVNRRFGCTNGSCSIDGGARGFRFPPGH